MDEGLIQLYLQTVLEKHDWGFLSYKGPGRPGGPGRIGWIGRLEAHLMRLEEASRTTAEKSLASAFRKASAVAKVEFLNSIIHGESVDTCLFWTLAPYVHQLLTKGKYKLTSPQALEVIRKWSETGKGYSLEAFTLKGLDELNETLQSYGLDGSRCTFILTTDSSDITHQAAKKLSKYLVETTLQPYIPSTKK